MPAVPPQPRQRSRSEVVLRRLSALPRWTVLGAVLLLVVVGLAAPPPAGVPCLLVLALLIGWLAYISWSRVDAGGRAMRVVVLAMVLAVALARATGALS